MVVTTEVAFESPDGMGSVARPLASLEVQLLPFDRDDVLDSLRAAFGRPEPPIPGAFLAARAQVRAAESEWRGATARWNAARDTVRAISAAIERFDPNEAGHAELVRELEGLDDELSEAERGMDDAFRRFSDLRRVGLRRADSIRTLRDAWAHEAFTDADAVFQAKQRSAGLAIVVDTTDAAGVAGARDENALRVRPGRYWVHARYELPGTELYWNVPITIGRGESLRVHLTRGNADERLRL